jgi:hypothetical protein
MLWMPIWSAIGRESKDEKAGLGYLRCCESGGPVFLYHVFGRVVAGGGVIFWGDHLAKEAEISHTQSFLGNKALTKSAQSLMLHVFCKTFPEKSLTLPEAKLKKLADIAMTLEVLVYQRPRNVDLRGVIRFMSTWGQMRLQSKIRR